MSGPRCADCGNVCLGKVYDLVLRVRRVHRRLRIRQSVHSITVVICEGCSARWGLTIARLEGGVKSS